MLRTRTFSYSVEDISACDVDEDIVQAEADPETPLVSVTNR